MYPPDSCIVSIGIKYYSVGVAIVPKMGYTII